MKRDKQWPRPRWMILAVCGLLVCVIWFVGAVEVLPVATPVHFDVGWTMDSCYWVYIQDSLRIDSSSKRYDVTEWPDTNFDLSYGHIHRIRLYYWAPGLDSANWEKTFDKYDYNNANCAGGGEYVAAFMVWDTLNDVGIPGAIITINQDSSTGSQWTYKLSEPSGYVEFSLPNGDWAAIAGKEQHSIPSLDFSVASAPVTGDTLKGYRIPFPAGAATAPYVAAYYDGGAGFVDSASGLMITRTNVTYYCQIMGAHAFADGSWGIVPQMQKKRPDANGRVSFLVVANLFLTPPTSYYRFWYEARDGTTRVRRTIRNFIVDSLPDPVNILTTTETFPGNY